MQATDRQLVIIVLVAGLEAARDQRKGARRPWRSGTAWTRSGCAVPSGKAARAPRSGRPRRHRKRGLLSPAAGRRGRLHRLHRDGVVVIAYGICLAATGVQVSSWLDACEDSIRTAGPSAGAPSKMSPRFDHSSTGWPRNVTRYASWPPAACTDWPRTVAIEISSAPFGDWSTTGPVCAAAVSAANRTSASNFDDFPIV